MYKILIVDDEKIIRNAICDVVFKNSDFEVFSAENGVQALSIIENNKIDAMFLDIKMPKLNGIEVLKTLNEKQVNIKTIVLSGYEEFEYAKVAIECGALNYLVKPVVPSNIIKLVADIKKILDKEYQQNKELEDLKKQMQENLDFVKEKLFNDILSNRIDKGSFNERLKLLNIELNGSYYQIAIIDILKYGFYATDEKYQLINYSIYQFLKKHILDYKNTEYFQINSNQFIILFSFDSKQPKNIKEELYEIKKVIDNKFNISSTIGIGNIYYGIDNIKRSYLEAFNTVRFEAISGQENVVDISEINGVGISLDYLFDTEAFLIHFKLGDIQKVKELLNQIFDKVENQMEQSVDIDSFNLFCIRILIYIFIALKEININPRNIDIDEKKLLLDVFELKSFDELKKKIFNIIDKASTEVDEYKKNKKKDTIDRIKSIINQNYNKDISTKYLSEIMYLNQNYLGQLFKNEAGISINDYLNRVRITKAKSLIKNTELMIYEVAEQVGFNDPQYFSTVFKKVVGVSPKEYKEI